MGKSKTTSEFSPKIFSVVLTGGIASGKSVVSRRFAELGISVIDTDEIARELVEPGSPALAQIVRSFGAEYLRDNRLDRQKMRKLVFADSTARAMLESILHPAIEQEVKRRVVSAHGAYCVLVIPLFRNLSKWPWVDRVLVVDCDESVQISRVMARDNIDHQQARAILNSQLARSERLKMADDVLKNDGDIEDLLKQVDWLHSHYLLQSKATPP